ncbi:MAG: hypothetical protein SWZ49_20420 [Cyanobacteriota bacterium]|nr:hypothetical protein [Cyanobacteriota bacterium]
MSKIGLSDSLKNRVYHLIEALIDYCKYKEEPGSEEYEFRNLESLWRKDKNRFKIAWKIYESKYYLFIQTSIKGLRDIVRARYGIKHNLGERETSTEEIKEQQASAGSKPISYFPITYDWLYETFVIIGYYSTKNIKPAIKIIYQDNQLRSGHGKSWRTLRFNFPDNNTDKDEILKKIEAEFKKKSQSNAKSQKNNFDYHVAYIPMKKAIYHEKYRVFERKIDSDLLDKAGLTLEEAEHFAKGEYNLRKEAYSKVYKYNLPESFLDDSDMNGDYSLFVVYTNICDLKKRILLTARTFTNQNDINKEICGDRNRIYIFDVEQQKDIEKDFVLPEGDEGEIFVVDRLASGYLREYKDELYGLLFRKIYDIHKDGNAKRVYAIARRQPQEYLMSKYVRLGMKVEGWRWHKIDRELQHWVLSATLEAMKSNFDSVHKILQTAKFI